MVKWTTLLIIAAVVIVAVIGIKLAINPSSDVPSTSSNTESAASANTPVQEGIIEMKIENFAFVPSELKIKVGSKVTWVNKDSTPHIIASDFQGRAVLSSEMLGQGDSYSHVFDEAGTYDYHCSIHTSMKGRIVVVA